MAGVYNQYTSEVSRELVLGYQCSRCGKRQIFQQTIRGIGVTDDKGVIRESTRVNRQLEARDRASENMDENLWKFKEQIKNKNFRSLHNVPPCSGCGHKELWGTIGNAHIETAMIFLIMATVVAVIVWLFSSSFGGSVKIYWPLGFAAVTAILKLINEMISRRQEAEIKKIPVKCLPVVLTNPENINKFLQ